MLRFAVAIALFFSAIYICIAVFSNVLESTEGPKLNANSSIDVVAYLVRRESLLNLSVSLHYLFHSFNDRLALPVLVFYESDDLSEAEARRALRAAIGLRRLALVEFHAVAFDFPSGYDPLLAHPVGLHEAARFPGYHHMCAFWLRGLFLHPRLSGVRYVLRLDADSYLVGRIEYDLFERLARRGVRYAYRARFGETCCVRHLTRFLHSYVRANGLSDVVASELRWLADPEHRLAVFPPDDHLIQMFYNNMEVLHVPTFRDDADVWRFADTAWRDPLLGEFGIYKVFNILIIRINTSFLFIF